ncbi:hypothetical protein [Nocardia sp. NBC_01329]|uniref:hypothetical protein n=1 Tax=Nocardia sp. NBC_01329 TaxID=2903594 RepID=UPI002E13D393|nr:hypothetical protein OG405_27535 [Nocardia sp. NBC_01329]
MDVVSTLVTAAAALIGVLVGGWITIRNQDRQWQREHARQWRDIRLSTYAEFVSAYREYVAFALEPTANIVVRPHPRVPELMPFFDGAGRPYKERLEAAMASMRLVCESDASKLSSSRVVSAVRQIAAARSTTSADAVDPALFAELYAAQYEFINTARAEIGLTALTSNPLLTGEPSLSSVPSFSEATGGADQEGGVGVHPPEIRR